MSRSKILLLLFILFYKEHLNAQEDYQNWTANFYLNDSVVVPFPLLFNEADSNLLFKQGEQRILLEKFGVNDSITYQFNAYVTSLVVHFDKLSKRMNGYWLHPDKSSNIKRIKFKAQPTDNTKTKKNFTFLDEFISHKWKIQFGNPVERLALGLFHASKGYINGSILTETGDFGYIFGSVDTAATIHLYFFSGLSIGAFKLRIQEEKLTGDYYYGKGYHQKVIATKDASFELPNPNSITKLNNDKPLEFIKRDILGKEISYPTEKWQNKVLLVQIFGSWCPNCIDETHFLKQLYKDYHEQGFEIISIGYEYPKDTELQLERLKRYQKKFDIPYTILLGGEASKALASSHFPMLNGIHAFPTTLLIDRQGKIIDIHTGFNGPSTGWIYDDYMLKMRSKIETALTIH